MATNPRRAADLTPPASAPAQGVYGDERGAPRAIESSDLTRDDYLRVGELLRDQSNAVQVR